jgi:hypothetical protein
MATNPQMPGSDAVRAALVVLCVSVILSALACPYREQMRLDAPSGYNVPSDVPAENLYYSTRPARRLIRKNKRRSF